MRTIFAFATLIAASPAAADPVDDWAKSVMTDHHVPGLAVAVTCKGEPLSLRTYGLANVEHDVPVLLETRFQSGSIGKQFTAALIQLLARDEKLSLDDPITRWIEDTPPSWSAITIRHLLSHTSGVGDYADGMNFAIDLSEQDIVDIIKNKPAEFAPGEGWAYSNSGYVLLGAIARAAGGAYWGDQVEERIFGPVGMATAQVIDDAGIVPHRASGYVPAEGGGIQNQWYASPGLNSTADGTLYVTILDMAKWERALSNASLLTEDELAGAWSAHGHDDKDDADYGYGWFLANRDGRDYVFHSGSWQGFNTSILRDRGSGMSSIFLANFAGLDIDSLALKLQSAARETYAAQGATACAD